MDQEQTSRPPSVAPPEGARVATTGAQRRLVEPIARRPERRAGDGDPPALATALRARIRNASARGDTETEGHASARLARALAGFDARIEEAVIAGRRAIALHPDDAELRTLVASLLEALGEPGLAAAIIRPVVDAACAAASRDTDAVTDAVEGLLALGDLLLRSGDLEGAIESFRYVTVVAPDRPDGQERLATARGVAPSAVTAESAARAYIGAAKKHQLAGNDARALEDLARAFEVDATSALASAVFADALEDLGRADAADAVRAEHAYALAASGRGIDAAARVHETRREKAKLRHESATALAAALDQLVDVVTYTEPGSPSRQDARARLDATLEDATAIAVARKRLHALLELGPASLDAWRAIAELAAGPGDAALRLEAFTEVVARDLGDEHALAALREAARGSRDATAIVDALVRALRHGAAQTPPAIWAARAAELALWAEERLDDPTLATWAWNRLLASSPSAEGEARARAELSRLAPRVAAAEAQLASAVASLADPDVGRRSEARKQQIKILGGRPDDDAQLIDAIATLIGEQPSDRSTLALIDRIAGRLSPDDAARALRMREESTAEPNARMRARRARVELALRRGDVEGARNLADDPEFRGGLAALRVALAERASGGADLGPALADLDVGSARERAVVLAAAARSSRLADKLGQARTHAELAMRADPRDLRGAYELAELAVAARDALPAALAGASLERALGGIGARGRWALALAAFTHEAGEAALSAAWTRRAWSLRPGDIEIARLWVQRAILLGDPELVAEVVRGTTALVASLGALAPDLADAVRMLFVTRPQLAEEILRGLLAIGGARLAPLREAALSIAATRPELVALEIAVQERWLASSAPAAERARVLLSIAKRAHRAGDGERAADAVARLFAEPECTPALRQEGRAILAALTQAKLSPDAELIVREGEAERKAEAARTLLVTLPRMRLNAEQETQLRDVADAFRALGRDRWDLGGDHEGALRAWLKGATLLGADGLDRLEADIAHFGGDAAARDALFELARRAGAQFDETGWPPGPLAPLFISRFQVRAWEKLLERPPPYVEPMSLAREAIARSPDPATLLPAVERLATASARTSELGALYDLAAGRAAGRYGERGVRYRAARVLDRGGRGNEALDQAVRAFAAVPGEGAILILLERLARTQNRPHVAINALVEAAEQAEDEARRATWLDRAAAVATEGAQDPEARIELLLRLFLTAPSARTVQSVIEAIRAAIAHDPSTKDTLVERLRRAHRRVDGKLGYVDRLPVLAIVAGTLAELDSVESGLDLVARGADTTPRQDLAPLRAAAEEIAARDGEAAHAWLDRSAKHGGPVRAHVAFGAGDPDRAIQELMDSAPEVDEFDFAEPASRAPGATSNEAQLLERWAPQARDKRVLAAAWARFGRQGGSAFELESARALDEAGQTEEAARALIQAWRGRADMTPETLTSLIRMAREILPHAGAHQELVEILVDDLENHPVGSGDAPDGVARWREIADLRANRLGDRNGALAALVEAGRLVPADDELWNEISDLAEALGAHDRLVAALAQRLQRARPEKRVQLLRKLARVLEHDLGRAGEAAERWAELVRLLPLDTEAADALERISERRGDRTELVELLRARASRLPVGHPDRTRALRRLARELESATSRRGEVLTAIREVHAQMPGDAEVAMQLARLARGAGDVGTAAEALMRAFRVAMTEGGSGKNETKGRTALAIEASRALLELHDYDTASRLLHEAATGLATNEDPRALEMLRLMLEIAIARGDARDEALTRIRIAELDVDAPPGKRAANCSSAARALITMGDVDRARELAWTAARATPDDASIAALLGELEFSGAAPRLPGKPHPNDVELLTVLGRIPYDAAALPETLSVIAFARAELLDASHSVGAGYRDLHGWPEEVRQQPLVQLAFAERLAAEWSFAPATAAYERAFAGDLRGFRASGPAALRAADAAARSNDPSRAKTFLDLAARDPACRIDARRRAVELARALGDNEGAIRALQRLAAEASGAVRAGALADQARLLKENDAEAAVETMRLAVEAAPLGTPLRADLERELADIDAYRVSHSLPPAPPPSLRDSATSSRFTEESTSNAVMRQLTGFAARVPTPQVEASAAAALSAQALAPLPVSPAPPAMSTDPNRIEPTSGAPSSKHGSGQRWISPNSTSDPPPTPPPEGGPISDKAEEMPPTERATKHLSEHPRLTMEGAPIPVAVPGLPRPADSEKPPLDLAALDRIALDPNAPVVERIRALKTLGEAAHEGSRAEEATRHFISALELGDLAAGDSAAELLGMMPGRAADLLLVRRRQAFLAPGDPVLLDALYNAILATKDHVFARAIDHVRRAFDPIAGPVPPPPLDQQLDRPDLVLPLLERRANVIAAEALRLAWEHAGALFRKDFAAYGIQGVDKVHSASAIGKVVASAQRLLGMSRTTVFIRQRSGRDVEGVLMSPAVVVLGGDCKDDAPETRYLLGVGMMAANPSHALLLAQPEAGARAAWQALLSAFGPPEHGRGIGPEIGRLAASLWQQIPRAPQRRLGEILGAAPPAFELALEGARQVARRTGLYLSGDLAAAVRSTLGEAGETSLLRGRGPMELADVCASYPLVADLVRLATSPEFAEARWRNPQATARRRTPSGNLPPSSGR